MGKRNDGGRFLRHGLQWPIAIPNIFSPLSSVCSRVDATHINRISSFYRSRAGFPLISIFLPTTHPAVRRLFLITGVYLSLSLPATTTVTGDYGKAMRRDGDNGCIACVRGGDIRGNRGRKQAHAEVAEAKGEN